MKLNKVMNTDNTALRIGEVRFSYPRLFEPNPETEKYSLCVLIPKDNKEAISMIQDAVAAAAMNGAAKYWSGKVPANLHKPLHDGDEERPDDPAYAGMYYLNASNKYAPKVVLNDGGMLMEATEYDVYPGCYGAVVLNFFPYNNNGNRGVGVSLGNVIKLRDGERLAGSVESAEASFSDLCD